MLQSGVYGRRFELGFILFTYGLNFHAMLVFGLKSTILFKSVLSILWLTLEQNSISLWSEPKIPCMQRECMAEVGFYHTDSLQGHRNVKKS